MSPLALHPDASVGATRPGVRDRTGAPIDVVALRPLLVRILQKWNPTQIWLFGSRARGDAGPGSDWDVLVVVPDDTPDEDLDPIVGWSLQKGSGTPADVIPCRAGEFEQARRLHNTLAYEAASEGVLLYER